MHHNNLIYISTEDFMWKISQDINVSWSLTLASINSFIANVTILCSLKTSKNF